MKRLLGIGVLFIATAIPASAQKLRPKIWPHIVLTAVNATATGMDYSITRYGVSHNIGTEANPMLRPFVHNNSIYAVGTVETGFCAYLGWKMHRSNKKIFRATWWMPQTVNTIGHIYGWSTWRHAN